MRRTRSLNGLKRWVASFLPRTYTSNLPIVSLASILNSGCAIGCSTDTRSGNSNCCYLEGPSKYAHFYLCNVLFKEFTLIWFELNPADWPNGPHCQWAGHNSVLNQEGHPACERDWSAGQLRFYPLVYALVWRIPSETDVLLFILFQYFQVATDKCIMLFLLLIVCGVIAIIIVKVCWILLLITINQYSTCLCT